jgi:hypothetical protein
LFWMLLQFVRHRFNISSIWDPFWSQSLFKTNIGYSIFTLRGSNFSYCLGIDRHKVNAQYSIRDNGTTYLYTLSYILIIENTIVLTMYIRNISLNKCGVPSSYHE